MTDSRVSWRHGVLRTDGDAWVFEDLRSTNGTFVGMQRVDRAAIGNDCVVRLGNPDDGPILRCTPQASAAPAPPAPAPAPPPEARPGPRTPRHYEPIPSAQPFPAPDPIRSAEFPVAYLERPVPPAPSWAAPAAKPDPSPAPAGAALARPELLPSVDRRPTSRMPLPAKAMRIGRDTHNDLVLPDLDVSRHHAELRKSPAGELRDRRPRQPQRHLRQRPAGHLPALTEQDIVSIGHSTFRLAGGELRLVRRRRRRSRFTAQDLVVKVGGGKMLLNHVTFPIPEKSLVGVIGPSGAGKSTLLGALTGMRPADTGTVLYDNRDLYRDYAELRYRIGLVPQESVLHTQLTARRALQYSGRAPLPGRHRRRRAGRAGRRGDGRARPDQAREHPRRPPVRRPAQAGQRRAGTADQAVAAVPGRADLGPGPGPGQVGHGADAGPGARRPDGHRRHAQRRQPGHLRPAARPGSRREDRLLRAARRRPELLRPARLGRGVPGVRAPTRTATGPPSTRPRPPTPSTCSASARSRLRSARRAGAARRPRRSGAARCSR